MNETIEHISYVLTAVAKMAYADPSIPNELVDAIGRALRIATEHSEPKPTDKDFLDWLAQ